MESNIEHGIKACSVECGHCKAPVEQTPGRGRVRQYCTPDHGRLHRRYMRAMGWL
ncbi:hypothetical protein ACFWRC_25360 [Streptomyces albidoflavus]